MEVNTNKTIYSIDHIKGVVLPIFEEYGIAKMGLFGSYSCGEATEESDIDIILSTPKGYSLLKLSGLMQDLQDALGKKVDFANFKTATGILRYYINNEVIIFMNKQKSEEKNRECILYIINELQDAAKLVKGYNFDKFFRLVRTQKSIGMTIINIGESAKLISEDFKKKYPEIDWKNLVGIRNVFAHNYKNMDIETTWDVVKTEFPSMLKEMKKIAKKEDLLPH